MSNTAPTINTNNNDSELTTNDYDDLDYTALTDVLEQTVFENFDDGLYIGMMSGTSLDGMDAVLCQFLSDNDSENTQQPLQIIASYSQDFPERLREVLLALCQPNGTAALTPNFDEPNDLTSELD